MPDDHRVPQAVALDPSDRGDDALQLAVQVSYCPSPKLAAHRGQPHTHMTRPTFERALEWAVALNDPADPLRAELSLTGIGEALLHPDFEWMLATAREALPANPIVFSTNGLLLTDELAARIAQHRPLVYVSLHRPERAKGAVDAARRHGILAGVNNAAAVDAFDWAGLLPAWKVSAGNIVCEYLRSGWGVVLVDGRIATCCLDAEGASVVGHVDDEIGTAAIAPWQGRNQGCATCHMRTPQPEELAA